MNELSLTLNYLAEYHVILGVFEEYPCTHRKLFILTNKFTRGLRGFVVRPCRETVDFTEKSNDRTIDRSGRVLISEELIIASSTPSGPIH